MEKWKRTGANQGVITKALRGKKYFKNSVDDIIGENSKLKFMCVQKIKHTVEDNSTITFIKSV